MLNLLLLAIRFFVLVFSGHKQVVLENVALRHQLAIFTRKRKRPQLRERDRVFWIALKKIWKRWRAALVIVQPETVISWQRKRFKRYWWKVVAAERTGTPRR
jgi:putative transposase